MQRFAQRYLMGDPLIWVVALALSLLSILVVYSATGSLAYRQMGGNTEYYLVKHSLLTFASLILMWITHRIDYRYYYTFSKVGLWLSLPLLVLTMQFGIEINEASRWLRIPFIDQSFQPADFARLMLFIHISGLLAKHQRDNRELKAAMVPILFWCASICGLIALSDISSAVLVGLTAVFVMFIGRIPLRYLAMLAVVLCCTGGAAMLAGQRGRTAMRRVERFVKEEAPYQSQQAYVAIASGGLLGKGPGKSDQRNFLPHSYSDFIYAIILEEYGLLGGLLVLLLYVVLLYRGSKVFLGTDRVFGGLLSVSLCVAIVVQAMVNMGVAVGLLPVTGLTLPFVSMGGSSQLFMGISLGIVLSVSRQDRACVEQTDDDDKVRACQAIDDDEEMVMNSDSVSEEVEDEEDEEKSEVYELLEKDRVEEVCEDLGTEKESYGYGYQEREG